MSRRYEKPLILHDAQCWGCDGPLERSPDAGRPGTFAIECLRCGNALWLPAPDPALLAHLLTKQQSRPLSWRESCDE